VRFDLILAMAVMLMAALLSTPARAQVTFETAAPFAILVDHESGTVLFQHNADQRMEPASMAKLMTVAVVFDELRAGRLSMDTEFLVSENAWRTGGAASGGSTMFAELNSRIRVEDLLKSVIIQSGNDASIVLAEGLAGSEATFALMMNELSRDLGLEDSHWTNSTGLPDPAMYTTPRDLADLSRWLIREFPEYYSMFAEPRFEWNGINQPNRNSLVEMGINVDGLKTGHTNASGYGSVVSTTEGGRRLIAVVHGLGSMRERTEEGRKLLLWGARAFERVPAFPEGEIVGFADVYGGETGRVGLVGEGSLDLYLPRGSRRCLSAQIVYRGPLAPPVRAGQQVAELRVFCDDALIQVAPLYAAADEPQGDITRRALDALKHLALGWL
jgi:D-alanyl-D-alanine carboxypeptidase (penicillin-binding protein 5/6)